MIRTLNFALVFLTGFTCLAVYRVAEETRISEAELRATEAAIADEQDLLAVLGAEWARVTQPARIQALAARHLPLSEQPTVQLSSLTLLPSRPLQHTADPAYRTASVVVPEPAPSAIADAVSELPVPARDTTVPAFTLASYPGM
jgi:hypothetical protein